ncbi:O-acyltransferase WSD1-like [Chenopodium quinoa]|uniref:Diacylglycerol O-acyltransferase n=1 Tax=Chenopodium quinoa TaxID=63459 RepID=A0A803M4T8_CHEQI|nr:O-acyltransferase WSD1-like [Chenopodium quinoa]
MEGAIGRRKKGVIKPIKVNKGIINLEEYEKEEPLSPSSVQFHKPNFNIHILAMMGCKTTIDVELCKSKVPITLLKHPRFSSIVVGDLCKGEELKWVRTEVDLDMHFIVPKIELENIESPEKYLEDYVYNLSKTTLDKSRPLWEIHILHLELSEDVKGIGIFRIHHSLGDGTSLISLMLALTRKTSDPTALPTIPVQKTYIDDDKHPKWFIWRWILALWWMLVLSWNTVIDVLMFVATSIFLKDKSPLKSSSRGYVNTSRCFVYRTFSLDDMKFVKNAIGGTVNDVALGIAQAGLSRYLNKKYGINGDDHIRLRSVLLINIRPSRGIQALADMMDKDTEAKWGNSFGYVLLPFTIGLHDDPLDYIREAKVTVDRKKNSLEVFYTYFIAEILKKLFGAKLASAVSDKINSHTTIAFSNLVGPMEEIGFYGHPLAFLAPSSYGQPHELMINFQSYINKMTLVLAVDEDAIPDPHQLCDDIVDSLKLVKDAVIAKGLVKNSALPNGCATTEQ